jgi:hypothetical protein
MRAEGNGEQDAVGGDWSAGSISPETSVWG